MKRWMTTGMILALGGLLPTLGLAQDPWDAPGAQSAGYHQQVLAGPSSPPMWHNDCPPGYSGYEQLLPDRSLCYDDDSRLDLSLRETFARSWARLEYLFWDITSGSGTLLGAPVSSGADLSGQDSANRLAAVDPINGPRALTSAIVPSLSRSPYEDLNGLRLTIGVPTTLGTLEANVWALERMEEIIRIENLVDSQIAGLPQDLIGAVTLLNNGVPSSTTMILFSEDYAARMQTILLGTQGNWVFNPFTPNIPIEVSPILGFRYIRMQDRLRIAGSDQTTIGGAPVTLDHEIASRADNNIFGPQVGLRFAHNQSRLEVGVDAMFLFGINKLYESVHTEQIYSPTEAPQTDKETRTRFAPVFDLTVYGRLHVTERFSLFAGYDFLVGTSFSRAFDNIDYNAPANVTNPPLIGLSPSLSEFIAHGLMVGGELAFR